MDTTISCTIKSKLYEDHTVLWRASWITGKFSQHEYVLFRPPVFWLHGNYTLSNRNTSFHIFLLFSTESIQDFHTILCMVLFCSTIYMKHFLTTLKYPQKVLQINNLSLN